MDNIIKRLKEIFPNLFLIEDGVFIDDEENEYAPPQHLDWEDIIRKMNEHGLYIRNY